MTRGMEAVLGADPKTRFGKELRKEFLFDDGWRNLNHGSFGTYPRAIQTVLRDFQDRAEAQPDAFIRYEYPRLLDEARGVMSKLLKVPTSTLVFVPNATTGVNTVLRNLNFKPGSHILYLSTIYGACEKSISYITETTPARAVKLPYTYPIEDDWLVEQVCKTVKAVEAKGGRVDVAVFDTVVSMPGVRMPFEKLAAVCREMGVLSCVDAAHGVGHVELDLGRLDPDFFVSNCHKWFHVPRGCAIFYVPIRNQHLIRSTLPTSHGFIPLPQPGERVPASPLPPSPVPKSAYESNFEFVGTIDSAPYLCIPAAMRWRESIGGEPAILQYCQTLAREGSKKVAAALSTNLLENNTETLTQCCMANVRLPLDLRRLQMAAKEAGLEAETVGLVVRDWISKVLITDHRTFMAVIFYADQWWIRLSGQVYLDMEDFAWAARTLQKVCARVDKGDWLPGSSKL